MSGLFVFSVVLFCNEVKWPPTFSPLFPPFRRLASYFSTFAPQEKLCINLKKPIRIFSRESDRFLLVGKKAGKAGGYLLMSSPHLRNRLENVDHSLELWKKSSVSPRHYAKGLCDFLCKRQRRRWIIDERVNIVHLPSHDSSRHMQDKFEFCLNPVLDLASCSEGRVSLNWVLLGPS
jgi:hypothetical protein